MHEWDICFFPEAELGDTMIGRHYDLSDRTLEALGEVEKGAECQLYNLVSPLFGFPRLWGMQELEPPVADWLLSDPHRDIFKVGISMGFCLA